MLRGQFEQNVLSEIVLLEEGRDGMIATDLSLDTGILTVHPQAPLEKQDFEIIAAEVDPYIELHGGLNGILIESESFPGWENFEALISHFRFIKDHHTSIAKVAAVTDSTFLSILPSVANHFVKAEVKHFHYNEKEAALAWLAS